MKYLVKTNDIGTLTDADYNRIVYDATTGFVYCKGTNAYEYVDLGLPSNLKWAKCNIGANSEEESGLYFQWGDTQGYTAEQVGNGEGQKAFSWADYKFSIDGSSSNFSKYNASDSKTVLDPEDDAAHAYMGGGWRVPTINDFVELFEYTDVTYVGRNKDINCVYDPNDYAVRLTDNNSSNTPEKIIFTNRNDSTKSM